VSRTDKLVTELCPTGVRTATLGKLGVIFGGLTGKSKEDFAGGHARFVSYVNVFNNIAVDIEADDFVRIKPGEKQRTLARGDILFTGSSETADEVAMSSVVTQEVQEPVYLNSFTIGFRLNSPSILEPDFAKHLFRSAALRKQLIRTASGVTRFNVSKARLAQVKVPLPPIEVQREIARVLDLFQSLGAALGAELEARRLQYEHYRGRLFTFPDDGRVRWATLGEISAKVSSGGTPLRSRSDYFDGGKIPWLRTQEVVWRDIYDTEMRITEKAVRDTSAKWIPENCVIVAISGASAARAAVNKIPLTTNQHCCNLEIDPQRANYRYVFQWVTANYEKLKAFGQGARSDLNAGLIKAFPVPVPSLAEQEYVATILDKFDALVNGRSFGLPAEIDARRKQYEYYRDRLLTFKELTA
jgi:type I restriction enzyme, S subunit